LIGVNGAAPARDDGRADLEKEPHMAKPAIELTISPETAFFILEKVRELAEKVEQTNPGDGSNPTDDRSVDVLQDMRDDPTLEEVVAAVSALNEDEQADLVALMWLGRGDFTIEEWDDARRLARARRSTPTAHYLAGAPLASDHLEEGLALLGYAIADTETGRRF
jgi:hypothetical protein